MLQIAVIVVLFTCSWIVYSFQGGGFESYLFRHKSEPAVGFHMLTAFFIAKTCAAQEWSSFNVRGSNSHSLYGIINEGELVYADNDTIHKAG